MRNNTRRSDLPENGHTTPEPALPAVEDEAPNDVRKPPAKKRKLDSSPPWKSATTQTPTSFVGEDGRRKSGRTNAVPLELLPPELQKTTPTRQRLPGRHRLIHPPSQTSASGSRSASRVNGKAWASSPGTTSSTRTKSFARRSSISKPSPAKRSRASAQTPTSPSKPRAQLGSKTTPVKAPPASKLPKPSPATGTRKSQRTAMRARHAVEEEYEQVKAEYDEIMEDRSESDDDSSELSSLESEPELVSELATPRTADTPKFKLKFSVPKPIITHPSHIPPAKEFATFEEFLDHDDPAHNEDTLRQAEEEAQHEAEIRSQLEKAVREGFLTPETCSWNIPDKQPEPERQYAHWDHLVAHALHFQKLLKRERREHVELMRKRNAAVMAEIRAKRPKTDEEKAEEQIVLFQKLYKENVSQMRRAWEEATKEVDKRRIERAKEEKRLAGKEHLKQMLKHSTQLLEARRYERQASSDSTSESETDDEEEDGDDEMEGEETDEGEENSVAGSEIMSSDEDEDDALADDDEKLTVEQLRAKYGGLSSGLGEASPLANGNGSASESEGEPAGDGLGAMGDAAELSEEEEPVSDVDMVDVRPRERSPRADTPALEDSGAAAVAPAAEVDDTLEEESDESVDMDSEGSDEEEDEDEDGDEDEDEDDDDGDRGSLVALYGDLASTVEDEGETEESGDEFQPKGAVESEGPEKSRYTSDVVTTKDEADPLANGHTKVVTFARDDTTNAASDVSIEQRDSPVDDSGKALSNGIVHSPDAESSTSVSQDAKDTTNDPSSPTTSPETSPQPSHDIKTPVPFLLRGTLREYQHYGLDWLAGLYNNNTNGILADEMGLGKTIQTIALLAHLACEKAVWGPHLIVVPTSVMLNWEMEFKKWAPGFKILTYYGSREQRMEKRKGWFDNNLWHVCITSYQLVLQDANTFKRRDWHYLVLDEAHNIKNFRSQRWQTLLNFKTKARLLLTGTPLQNNMVELWSLLYFLMPAGSKAMPLGFTNLEEFQQWFSNPVDKIMAGGREGLDDEARKIIRELHKILRPYLLRRLKTEVEKQMPGKYEHIVYCRLSKRQRFLYDDFMSMAKTRETLASGNYLSIINCLMQLRKVCNHPDLFETRQIVTSFAMPKSVVADYEVKELLVRRRLLAEESPDTLFGKSLLDSVGLVPAKHNRLSSRAAEAISRLSATEVLQKQYEEESNGIMPVQEDLWTLEGNEKYMDYRKELSNLEKLKSCVQLNRVRTAYRPLMGDDLVEICTCTIGVSTTNLVKPMPSRRDRVTEWFEAHSETIRRMIPSLEDRAKSMESTIQKFGCVTPAVVATDMAQIALSPRGVELAHKARDACPSDPYHAARMRLSIAFPDKRLLQYDCGKLQRLDALLRKLQAGGHRALIFTQMTKVLDILEQFLNIHGHRYLRLDGATKIEQRQILTDRFNNDPRIPVFILSTRSGGLGINLTGADTVIFYDLDWNPAMDKQCQDRCHRIGQTRDVHIYRFVSEYTIESNILRKSDQKRMLDDVVIQEGEFTTDYFNKLTIRDMLGDEVVDDLQVETANAPIAPSPNMAALEAAEDDEDRNAAKVAQKEIVDTDVADFAEAGRTTPAPPKEPPDTATDTPASIATPKEAPVSLIDTTPRGLGHDRYGIGWNRVDRENESFEEYMIRFLEWELKDVPVVIPVKSRDKRKRGKKGKPF